MSDGTKVVATTVKEELGESFRALRSKLGTTNGELISLFFEDAVKNSVLNVNDMLVIVEQVYNGYQKEFEDNMTSINGKISLDLLGSFMELIDTLIQESEYDSAFMKHTSTWVRYAVKYALIKHRDSLMPELDKLENPAEDLVAFLRRLDTVYKVG